MRSAKWFRASAALLLLPLVSAPLRAEDAEDRVVKRVYDLGGVAYRDEMTVGY